MDFVYFTMHVCPTDTENELSKTISELTKLREYYDYESVIEPYNQNVFDNNQHLTPNRLYRKLINHWKSEIKKINEEDIYTEENIFKPFFTKYSQIKFFEFGEYICITKKIKYSRYHEKFVIRGYIYSITKNKIINMGDFIVNFCYKTNQSYIRYGRNIYDKIPFDMENIVNQNDSIQDVIKRKCYEK